MVRTLAAGLGALPRPASIVVGRCLGRAAYYGFGRLRRIGERNLALAYPRQKRSEHHRILRGCFDSLGRQLAEFSHFPHATPESLRRIVEYDPDSEKLVREAKNRGRGMLYITAHLGAWELLVFAQSAFGDPLSFLARPLENRRIDGWVTGVRSRFGNQPIDKRAAGLACLRILRNGGNLGLLADLNALPQEGVFVPFFGELACTTVGVAALALPSDATVFPVFAPWDKKRKRYVFQGGPALDMTRTGDPNRDLLVNTARVAAVVERAIRKYPDQWMWIHDRWHAYLRPGDRICTDFPPV